MSITFVEARDEMFKLFKDAWDTTNGGDPYTAFYEDVKNSRDTSDDPWAVVSLFHATGRQATLQGAIGSRVFRREGFLTVQIFTKSGNGLQEAYTLAKLVSDAYEGASTSGGVWFRNTRINEIGRDGEFFQTNVVVEFQYDEIK